MRKELYMLICFVLFSISFSFLNAQQTNKKWYPGHYIIARGFAVQPGDPTILTKAPRDLVLANPVFKGYKALIYWSDLEKSKGQYDFSKVLLILDQAHTDNKKVMLQVMDRNWNGKISPVPQYITTEAIYKGGTYVNSGSSVIFPKLWVPEVGDRLAALISTLGDSIDSHPALAGVIMDESSLPGSTNQADYSTAGYLNSMKKVFASATTFKKTPFFQSANWANGMNSSQQDEFFSYLVETHKHGFGGPDIASYRAGKDDVVKWTLSNAFGKYYSKYRGIAPIAMDHQSSGYTKTPSGYTQVNAKIVIAYAVDSLNASFINWAPIELGVNGSVWSIHDAIAEVNSQNGRINTTPPSNLVSTNIVKSSSLKVYTVNQTLRMEGLTPGNQIEIVNISGNILISYTADADHFETALSKGFYLVKAGNEVKKTIIF